MDITLDEELEQLIRKLRNCQDSKTGEQRFFGLIRLEFTEDRAQLFVEERVWETESGDRIQTDVLRAP